HDVFLESVLQCTAAKASSVYQNYVKNLPSDIQKSKVAGLGQSAVAAYIPAVGQNPASDAVIWVEGPYLFYLDYIGNSKSFSPGWLSGRAQALKTQDFVA
ncbi:MAG TPA: hypothetical protein VGS21_05025, partial [Acidimicrobiales bacterium]|nr:hypothetical protein [Acidimicrobiales bacterium]